MPRETPLGTDYDLPLPRELLQQMVEKRDSLAELAAMTDATARRQLRSRWAALHDPVNRTFADHLLSQPQLGIRLDRHGSFSLDFSSEEKRISLTALHHDPLAPNLDFPIASIPGLLEFITTFGGVSDGCVPSRFATPSELRVMRDADPRSAWGPVGPWDGSLIFYLGGTGDVLVVRPNGAVGKWHHEFAAPVSPEEYREQYQKRWSRVFQRHPTLKEKQLPGLEQGPVGDLRCDFPALIGRYLEYCQMEPGSDPKKESSFYY